MEFHTLDFQSMKQMNPRTQPGLEESTDTPQQCGRRAVSAKAYVLLASPRDHGFVALSEDSPAPPGPSSPQTVAQWNTYVHGLLVGGEPTPEQLVPDLVAQTACLQEAFWAGSHVARLWRSCFLYICLFEGVCVNYSHPAPWRGVRTRTQGRFCPP